MPLLHRLQALTAAIALGACGVYLAPAPAAAAAPMVKTQAPGFYRMLLGAFGVTAINDGTVSLDVAELLAEPTTKTAAALKKSFESSPLEPSDNAFIVNTVTKLVLIDTGGGTMFDPTLGKLLANLRAAGYQPEQVDDVFLTYMHPPNRSRNPAVTSRDGHFLKNLMDYLGCFKKSTTRALVASGCSCCTQWPAPSIDGSLPCVCRLCFSSTQRQPTFGRRASLGRQR